MEILEYVLMALLFVSAVFIIVAVVLQKGNEDGLSGTIAGGSETFYGKDKSARADRKLYRWTAIAAIVFAVCVFAVFVIQPDFSETFTLGEWKESSLNNYSHIFE